MPAAILVILLTLSILAPREGGPGPILETGSPGLYEASCGNGLPLVIDSRPGSGTVYIRVTVRAGSRDEPTGRGGLAHLLEHLLFKEGHDADGARNAGFSDLRSVGAAVNASTSFEETEFHAEVPPERFDEGVEALLDLVTAPARQTEGPLFVRADVEKEKRVVLQEVALARVDPLAVAAWTVLRDVFPGDPIGQPVIGTRRSLRSITVPDLGAFYRTHYTTERMFVVVAGDVDPQAAYARVCAPRESLAHGTPREPYPDPSPRRRSPHLFRTLTDRAWILAGSLTGGTKAPDDTALSLIAAILGDGRSSRLHRRLVEQEAMAPEVLALAYQVSNAGAFGAGVAVEPGAADAAIQALREELGRLTVEPVLPWEIENARVRQESRLSLEMQTNEGAAAFRSRRILSGRPVSRDALTREMTQITPMDLMAAARARWGEESGGPVEIQVIPARGLGKALALLRYLLFRRL